MIHERFLVRSGELVFFSAANATGHLEEPPHFAWFVIHCGGDLGRLRMRGQAGLWDIDERYARLSEAGDPLEKLNGLWSRGRSSASRSARR